MQKLNLFFGVALLFVLLGVNSAFGFQDYSHTHSIVKICGDHICASGEYVQLQRTLNNAQRGSAIDFQLANLSRPIFEYGAPNESTNGESRPNFIMDIHIPNHVDYYGVVLSYDDFQTLKTNIGIMAVIGITTTNLPENTNYCNLATAIWNGQDASFKAKYSVNLVIPPTCNIAPVPEFSHIAFIVMLVAMISGIVITAKHNMKFRPK